MSTLEVGELGHCLRKLVVLEHLNSISNTQVGAYNCISRGPEAFLWLPWVPRGVCSYIHSCIHTHESQSVETMSYLSHVDFLS